MHNIGTKLVVDPEFLQQEKYAKNLLLINLKDIHCCSSYFSKIKMRVVIRL
jgi:hypothetical protein